MTSRRAALVEWARAAAGDVDFTAARNWISQRPGRKAAGFLPVYAPREAIRAAGLLPVGIHGAGELEIIRGDAFYQSYICHLPRSVVELAQSGRLSFVSAMLFPSTCDVIRNLSGVWRFLDPTVYVRYLDLPQVFEPRLALEFWSGEIRSLVDDLGEISGKPATQETWRESIELYNRARSLVRALYRKRRESPECVPTEELLLLAKAGEVVPVETFIEKAEEYLAAADDAATPPRDRVRVIVAGAFCEQPPLGLVKTIERAGCAIVDDDFLLGNRLLGEDVPVGGDPAEALARTFLRSAAANSTIYEPDPSAKRELMRRRVEAAGAEGVVFAAASFCDPALLDRPMLRGGAEAAGIPCIAFQFAENTGQFQQFREQAGTFADSIKLWGGRS